MRYELTDYEWGTIKPMLPNKPRGVPRVNDRRFLNGIFWVLRSGAPWRDLRDHFGPYTTCYNRFVRWRRAGVWAKIMSALAHAHDAAVDDRHVHCPRASARCLHSPEQKAGHGAITGRVDQQDSCGGRYQWPAGPARTDGWGGARLPARWQAPIPPEVRNNAAGRSWLRCRLDQSPCSPVRRLGEHPTKTKSD